MITAYHNTTASIRDLLTVAALFHRWPAGMAGFARLLDQYEQLGPPHMLTVRAVDDITRIIARLTLDLDELLKMTADG